MRKRWKKFKVGVKVKHKRTLNVFTIISPDFCHISGKMQGRTFRGVAQKILDGIYGNEDLLHRGPFNPRIKIKLFCVDTGEQRIVKCKLKCPATPSSPPS